MRQADMAPWRETGGSAEQWEPQGSEMWVPAPEKGDGVPMAGRVSSTTKALAQEVVQCGKFRVRTENELVRVAVEYWLQRFAKPEFLESSLAGQALQHRGALLRHAAMVQEAEAIKQLREGTRRAVRMYGEVGLDEKAVQFLARTIRQVRAHPEEDWRGSAERALKSVPSLEHLWMDAELMLEKGEA